MVCKLPALKEFGREPRVEQEGPDAYALAGIRPFLPWFSAYSVFMRLS